jgi:hypothetical protein
VNTFRVWVQPTDYSYFLLVDGVDNARWLLDRLGQSFVFRSSQPIKQEVDSSLCTFQVPRGPLLSLNKLHALLAQIPEVTLLRVAAVS